MTLALRPVAGLALVAPHAPSLHVLFLLACALALAFASASTSSARRARRPSRRARREEASPRPPRGGSVPGDPQREDRQQGERWGLFMITVGP